MQSDADNTRLVQPNHTNPVQASRRPTNVYYIFVFILIVLLWSAVGFQAFARQSTEILDENLTTNEENILFSFLYELLIGPLLYFSPDKETFGKVFLLSLLLGGLSVLNCIILIKIFTRSFIYMSLLLLFVIYLTVGLGSIVIFPQNLVINIFAVLLLVDAITGLFCVYKVGLNVLCEIVQNTTRAIIDCPTMLVFTFVIVALEILIAALAINTMTIILWSNDSTIWIVSFSLINVYGGFVINTFIILFAMAVISEYSVNWFWTKDKKEVSTGLILKSIANIFRYHLGTIALESTLIMPFMCTIVRAIKYRNKSNRARNCGDIYLDCIAKITLVSTTAHSSLIHTSIYGSDFIKATKKTFQIVLSNSPLYLATIEILNMITVIGIIGNTVVMFFTAYTMVRIEHILVHSMPLPFLLGFYLPITGYSILMISVGEALLMNKMIILSVEQDSKENPVAAL